MRKSIAACAAMAATLCMAPARPVARAALSAFPGDVLRIEGSATVFGKEWRDLIGIDLNVKPGSYPIRGAQFHSGDVLRVQPKRFPVRRLNVSPDFVNPPPDALPRIAAENKRLGALFARVTDRQWKGPFALPAPGQPTSNFGTRSVYNGQPRSAHTGVDFMGAAGTPVHAGNIGTVVLAEPLYFTGNTVVVDYGEGVYSLFAHLSEFRVHEGDRVEADTVVGLIGATGRVTGPHLHWSVRLRGAHVDPLSLLNATK